jgi:hypothetical protein
MISHVSPITDRAPFGAPGSVSPEANRPGTGYTKVRPGMPYHSPKDGSGSPYTPITNTPPTGFPTAGPPNGVDSYMHHDGHYGQRPPHHSPNGPGRPSVQTNVTSYGVLSPVSTQHGYHSQHATTPQSGPFVQQQNFPPFNLPPSDFSTGPSGMSRESGQAYAPTTSAEYAEQHAHQSGDMMMLDHMGMQQTIPVFGSDSIMNKSPYVSIPEDFVAYLFNTQNNPEGSPMGQVVPSGAYSR